MTSPLIRPRILAKGFSDPLPLLSLPPSGVEALAPSPATPFEDRVRVFPVVEFVRCIPVPFANAGEGGSVGTVEEFESAGEKAGTEFNRGEIDEEAGVSSPRAVRPRLAPPTFWFSKSSLSSHSVST